MPKRGPEQKSPERPPKRVRRLSTAGASPEADRNGSETSVDDMPHVPPTPIRNEVWEQTAPGRTTRATARQSQLLARLNALPKDIQTEYLGPGADFANGKVLDRYELGLGVERFNRIYRHDDDIPNVVIRLHPHLFVDLETFKAFAACLHEANPRQVLSENLWKRQALAEARPYQSVDPKRGLCKRQQREMDEQLSGLAILDVEARNEISSRHQANRLIDARTYTSLRELTKQSYGQKGVSDHLAYLKSEMKLSKRELAQLTAYNQQCPDKLPEMIARKGDHSFISGELVKRSQELLRAPIFELHAEEQIQLMNHYPTGGATGEYKSLFTHARGNFALPNAVQTEQLGLPPSFVYKKEGAFDAKYKHRDYFHGGMKPPAGINSEMEKNNPYMYRRMDFDALLQSDYHRIRVAISLLEDQAPLDLDRCERIKGLLDLDDNLRCRNPAPERTRERSAGRA